MLETKVSEEVRTLNLNWYSLVGLFTLADHFLDQYQIIV